MIFSVKRCRRYLMNNTTSLRKLTTKFIRHQEKQTSSIASYVPALFKWRKKVSSQFDLTPAPIHLSKQQKPRDNNIPTTVHQQNIITTSATTTTTLQHYWTTPLHAALRYQEVNRFIDYANAKRANIEAEEELQEAQEKSKKEMEKKLDSRFSILKTVESLSTNEGANDNQLVKLEKENTEFVKSLSLYERKEYKELKSIPGFHSIQYAVLGHPYQIRWNFYCQAKKDWNERLDKIYGEIYGSGTQWSEYMTFVYLILTLGYAVAAFSVGVFMKFTLILRFQLFTTATVSALLSGILWGYGIGNDRFFTQSVKKAYARSAALLLSTNLIALTVAMYDYHLGYHAMDCAALSAIGMLSWMRYRGLIQKWIFVQFGIIYCASIASNQIGKIRAPILKERAEIDIYETPLDNVLSMARIIKKIAPKSVRQLMDAEERYVPQNDD